MEGRHLLNLWLWLMFVIGSVSLIGSDIRIDTGSSTYRDSSLAGKAKLALDVDEVTENLTTF